MRFFFELAEKYDRKRKALVLPNHLLPEFILDVWAFLKWFIKIYLYAFFIFTPFCFFINSVYSGSMTPTCQTNELVLSSRLGYGIKLSRIFLVQTQKETFLDKVLWQYDEPKLGDVVALNIPNADKESTYTKRIVGTQGDRVQFKNGILFINRVPVKLIFKKEYTFVEHNQTITGQLYEEILPNGVKHEVLYLYTPGYGSSDNTEEFLIPPGHVFCCGDNRQDSDDSRTLFGFVEKKNILGKVVMVLFSNGNITSLNVKQFIKGINWDRCLKWMI